MRRVFDLRALWAEIEALDGKVAAPLQGEMLLDIADIVGHAAAWLLRAKRLDIGAAAALFAPAVGRLGEIVPELLPPADRALLEARVARFAAAGVPAPLAGRIGRFIFLVSALEVGDLAARIRQPIERAARTFYGVGARFALDDLRAAARRLPAETNWQKAAAETVIDNSYGLQAELSARVLDEAGAAATRSPPGPKPTPPHSSRPRRLPANCAPPRRPIWRCWSSPCASCARQPAEDMICSAGDGASAVGSK